MAYPPTKNTMKVLFLLVINYSYLISVVVAARMSSLSFTKLIQRLGNIGNEQKIQLNQIGFGVPIFSQSQSAVNEMKYNSNITRKLTAEYKFTPCPNERSCNKIIATYTKIQVKDIIDTILSTLINVEGCLDEHSEYYGQCRVDDDCICPTFVSSLVCPFGLFCATPICQEDCYRNSLEST